MVWSSYSITYTRFEGKRDADAIGDNNNDRYNQNAALSS